GNEELVLDYFFTNSDKSIFALKNVPAAVQAYFYMGISRFPGVRERFIKVLQEQGCFEAVAEAVKTGNCTENAMRKLSDFAREKNRNVFFDYGHWSSGESGTIFFVSEKNPIYATEIQQDFYFPLTTMELSTRYSRKFSIEGVYWDPELMKTEFAEEAKKTIAKNLGLYENGFGLLAQKMREKNEKQELPEKVSVLDSLRNLIPIATYTTVILGGNTRAVLEHFKKLLSCGDSFTKEYAEECMKEGAKIFPEYYSGMAPAQGAIDREKRLSEYAKKEFGKKFSRAKENIKMFLDLPAEETALAQILYPYCNITFEELFGRVSGLKKQEREEIFRIATEGRKNRDPPPRGFETRPAIFEVEAPWSLWKDFKRNRMNLRFHQPMRGLSGFEIPDLIKGSAIEKDYCDAMQKTSDLIEKVFQKYPALSKTVAAQGNKKRFLLCMGARQLTVLAELRTCGEGDKGYRRIASRMIELAKEKKPELFAHIQDNYKK
ncbi:MAG: FAD-dependent thymidylate synthase, partial [Candidatus ainarchaeum sp.]|nr:FAD-dependent thymidylate synthase [Candidatus ainarchaeum sp.]